MMKKVLFEIILLIILICSLNSSTTAISKDVTFPKPINERNITALGCSSPNKYRFIIVENPKRKKDTESPMPKDLKVIAGRKAVAKIELPIADWEVKNFSLNSIVKTKIGFDVNIDWGGGLYYYEIRFNFICKENKFYLYEVKNENFSTTNPNSKNFLDKKETKITKIEPNLPIGKFVMQDYLE